MKIVILVVGLGLILAVLNTALRPKRKASSEANYTRQGPLCTPAELNFLKTLRASINPGHCVMAKVRLLDLLKPSSHAAMRRISQKHVDFVVCETSTTSPLYIIELNDKSHGRADRAARDQFLARALGSAGIPIHWQKAQSKYDVREFRAAIAVLASQVS